MDLNALRCRTCGAAIDVRDVLEELAIAKCRFCSTVLDLSRRGAEPEPQAAHAIQDPPRQPSRPAVPVPARFKVDQ